MAMHDENLRDVEYILGIVKDFVSMDTHSYFKFLKENPSEFLHQINHPKRGNITIGREGSDRFRALAKRCKQTANDSSSFDLNQIDNAIRKAFVDLFLVKFNKVDRQSVDKMLSRALKWVKKSQRSITHFIPCVFSSKGKPEDFHLGPVRFVSKERFFNDYWVRIKRGATRDVHKYINNHRKWHRRLDIVMNLWTSLSSPWYGPYIKKCH